MAPRANWKGFLKVAEVTCPVSLYTAASTSDRITFHTLNRKTGNRVNRQFIDSETGKPVETEDQVKGYDTGEGDYIILEPEEIAAAVPEGDKTLGIEAFVRLSDVDDTFLDRPYYLAPTTPIANEAFALIRDGMYSENVVALARTVLFRRMRTLLVRPHDGALVASTLHFDYEIRSAEDAFSEIPEIKIEGEMLDLARHIITTKKGEFDPKTFDDRYEAALAELVRAKIEGREIKQIPRPEPTKVTSLMEALRQSAGQPAASRRSKSEEAAKKAAPRRKAS
ncbi:MAG: Ku protein [Hyphomicrobiales bacterium]|nr:Ku protein [Hyphomicrobiales bacterium]